MKLKVIEIDVTSGVVKCRCMLDIQGKEFPVEFQLLEYDIYAKAAAGDRDSWENSDLVAVAKEKLNLDVSI
jgi:hypothetical protein